MCLWAGKDGRAWEPAVHEESQQAAKEDQNGHVLSWQDSCPAADYCYWPAQFSAPHCSQDIHGDSGIVKIIFKQGHALATESTNGELLVLLENNIF